MLLATVVINFKKKKFPYFTKSTVILSRAAQFTSVLFSRDKKLGWIDELAFDYCCCVFILPLSCYSWHSSRRILFFQLSYSSSQTGL